MISTKPTMPIGHVSMFLKLCLAGRASKHFIGLSLESGRARLGGLWSVHLRDGELFSCGARHYF